MNFEFTSAGQNRNCTPCFPAFLISEDSDVQVEG